MKKKVLITEIIKSAVNCIILPLYFIKFYHQVAVLPGRDENGELIISQIDHYYSIFYKLDREELAYLFWLAFSVCIASILFSVLRIAVKDSKALKITSHVVFAVSLVFFLTALYISLQISYKY